MAEDGDLLKSHFPDPMIYPLESASSPSVFSFSIPAQPCLPASVISCQIPHTPLQGVSFLLKIHEKIKQLSIMLIMLCLGWRHIPGTLKDPQDHQRSAYEKSRGFFPGRLHSKERKIKGR